MAVLPLFPFLAFCVQPNYREQTLSGMIRLQMSHFYFRIPLTLILNRDLRRILLMIYGCPVQKAQP
jgi:hypothetical protein